MLWGENLSKFTPNSPLNFSFCDLCGIIPNNCCANKSGGFLHSAPLAIGRAFMIITDNYTLECEPQRKAYRVHSRTAPYCPRCGFLMSGYDNLRRKAIDSTGAVYWLLVRRLRCSRCNSYHIELPSILAPFKQYEESVICCANEKQSSCPAESSTMRRWKK